MKIHIHDDRIEHVIPDYKRDFPGRIICAIKDENVFESVLQEQASQIALSLFSVVGSSNNNNSKMILIVYESVLNDKHNNLQALQKYHSSIELIVVCGNERSIEYLLDNEIFKKVIINSFV